jgi:hypothetical protein
MTTVIPILGSLGSLIGALWGYLGWRERARPDIKAVRKRELKKIQADLIELRRLEEVGVLPLYQRETREILVQRRIEAEELAKTENEIPRFRRTWKVTRRHAPQNTVPSWAFLLLTSDDAQRYKWEWGDHLRQLIEDDEIKQARIDRRRLARAAIFLAIVLRIRRTLGLLRRTL